MCVLKLTLRKIIIFANFPLFSAFQCEASGRTWLTVQTHAVLSIASLASGLSGSFGNTSGRNPYKFLSISFFLCHLHSIAFFFSSFYVQFSRGFLLRFWHSLHIYSHSVVISLSSSILLSFCTFQNIGIFS
jgi:hypothetical protein